jgi:hypothetical protein
MAVTSALGAGRTLPAGRFLVINSVRGCVDCRAIVLLEGLGQLKNPMTLSGIEPATFRLVAKCLKQQRGIVFFRTEIHFSVKKVETEQKE